MARASTVETTGDHYVVRGEFFTVTLEKKTGRLVTEVRLFDGAVPAG